ncbi:MAG TPA: YihY/virulence factor BrkB family protein [Gemmataceae bacterium]|nr:YihY/virulence factor BrkB family protein [Gemmataceae bacterium]
MAFTSVRLREAWNWGGLSFRELAVRSYRAMDRHDTLNQAAVVAFYAMLALVPLLSLSLAFALGAQPGVAEQVKRLGKDFMPPEANKLVGEQIEKIEQATPVGLLSLSALILLWSASSLFVAIMDTTNAAYGVRDDRPWWKKRLLAIVLTLAEIVLLIGASITIAVWPHVMGWLGLSTLAITLATVVQWIVVVIALLAGFALAYFFGPSVVQEWEWITPGSTLGVLALIAASLGFQLYLRFGDTYGETYGALAGVVLMMLWLYLAALALLVGAEVNCVIEHAAPHGKAPGQKNSPPVENIMRASK